MDPALPKAERASSAPVSPQQSLASTLLQESSTSSSRKRRQPGDRPSSETIADRPLPQQEQEWQQQRQQQQQQQQEAYAPSTSSSHQELSGVSPQHGPSQDTGTMQRSLSPEEGGSGVRYTRTGRVSRALKGKRVHHCEECGKVYTRKEHLKRHQQNHKPGAFPCDLPGCSRSFNREDLLIRHKQKHNDSHDASTRRNSFNSSTSGQEESHVPPPLQPIVTSPQHGVTIGPGFESIGPAVAEQAGDHRRSPRKGYLNLNELRPRPELCSNLVPTEDYRLETGDGGHRHSPYDSPISDPPYGNTPFLQPYRSFENMHHDYFTPNVYPYQPPGSPVSAVSSLNPPPDLFYQPPHDHQYLQNGYHGSYDGGNTYVPIAPHTRLTVRISEEMMAESRDQQERNELTTPATGPLSHHEIDSSLDESTLATEQRYLECYWNQLHPHFPVIHKPTFNLLQTSPLLKAAILALGSQAQGTRTDTENARILHDRCLRVLKKRTASRQHTYRVVDMQALLLVELFAIFKARRFPVYFSRHFEDMYQKLAETDDCFQPLPLVSGDPDETLGRDIYQEVLQIEQESKQRLLAACYILDTQNSTLFGRVKSNRLTNGGADLIFPRSTTAWDDESDHYMPKTSLSVAARSIVQSSVPGMPQLDAFQSMLLIVYTNEGADEGVNFYLGDLRLAIEQKSRTLMAYHTLMLCKHTPMRDLLAVAGESWVTSEKLSSPAEFTQSQLETHDWAQRAQPINYTPLFAPQVVGNDSQSKSQQALFHAFEILKIQAALNQSRTSLVFHEWAIYLATIVIWAQAYVNALGTPSPTAATEAVERRPSRPRVSIPSPTEPQLSFAELEQSLSLLIQAGPSAPFGWKESKAVLLWAKGKLYSAGLVHYSGLTNMALDILGKLATRGNERGWF